MKMTLQTCPPVTDGLLSRGSTQVPGCTAIRQQGGALPCWRHASGSAGPVVQPSIRRFYSAGAGSRLPCRPSTSTALAVQQTPLKCCSPWRTLQLSVSTLGSHFRSRTHAGECPSCGWRGAWRGRPLQLTRELAALLAALLVVAGLSQCWRDVWVQEDADAAAVAPASPAAVAWQRRRRPQAAGGACEGSGKRPS